MTNQTQAQYHAGKRELPYAVINFPNLPNDAYINRRAFQILLGCGDTTFFRRKKNGQIPPPDDQHGNYRVSTVREVLNNNQEAA